MPPMLAMLIFHFCINLFQERVACVFKVSRDETNEASMSGINILVSRNPLRRNFRIQYFLQNMCEILQKLAKSNFNSKEITGW
jgi:hypothetical protein